MKRQLKAYDPKKKCEVLVGEFDEETKILERIINFKKHWHEKMDGYCIQDSAFKDMITSGCKWIIYYVTGSAEKNCDGKWFGRIYDFKIVPNHLTGKHGVQFCNYRKSLKRTQEELTPKENEDAE